MVKALISEARGYGFDAHSYVSSERNDQPHMLSVVNKEGRLNASSTFLSKMIAESAFLKWSYDYLKED